MSLEYQSMSQQNFAILTIYKKKFNSNSGKSPETT